MQSLNNWVHGLVRTQAGDGAYVPKVLQVLVLKMKLKKKNFWHRMPSNSTCGVVLFGKSS